MRSELVTAWRLAVTPTNRSFSLVKATTLGVVLAPSEFAITTGCPPSRVATQLFVVPKSIPITGPLIFIPSIQFRCSHHFLRYLIQYPGFHYSSPKKLLPQPLFQVLVYEMVSIDFL